MGGVFTGWISAFPFIMLFGAYEGPKVVWLWAGGFCLALYFIYQIIRRQMPSVTRGGLLLLLWIFILGISSVIGLHPVDSIVGGSYRHQGVLFFFTLFLIAETLPVIPSRHKEFLCHLLAIGVLAESALVIQQKLFDWSLRPLGTLGEPNAIAGFLAIGLFWVVKANRFPSWVRGIAYAVVLAAIAATESRAGMAAALIVTVGLGIRLLKARFNNIVWVVGTLLAVCVIAVSFYTLIRVNTILRPPSIIENRQVYWQLGIEEFMKRPLLGYGAESEEVLYDAAFSHKNIRLVDFMVDRSHNLFLDVALWSGAVGLLVFIGWLGSIVRGLYTHKHIDRLLAMTAWIVFACVQPVGVVHWVQLILLWQGQRESDPQ